jgi:hypothetical protein
MLMKRAKGTKKDYGVGNLNCFSQAKEHYFMNGAEFANVNFDCVR